MRAPGVETLHVVEILRSQLPAALNAEAPGWSLRDVRTEHFFDHAVVTLTLTREGQSVRAHLLPVYALKDPFARSRHFDLYHRDDLLEGHAAPGLALLERLVLWLDHALSREGLVSLEDAGAPPADVDPPEVAALIAALRERLPSALAEGSLAGLIGWTLERVVTERFRLLRVPRLLLTKGGVALHVYLLPRGSEETCHFHTSRFDVVYDDDARANIYTQNHATLDGLVAWLDAAFPADERPREPRRLRPASSTDEATRQAEAEAAAIDRSLRQAIATGALPELAGWTFAGLALEAFRGADVPTARFEKDGAALTVRLLPTDTEPTAHFRTDRFDLLYDDDAAASGFSRHHALIERLTGWLSEAFPLGESDAARKLAQRRALRDQRLQAPPALADLADALDERLREAITSGALALPEAWRFEEAALEQQQGVEVPTVRFTHGARPFTLRLLPTAPERTAPLRTTRFDVLYDSDQGDWQLQDEPLARAFVAWLEGAFPGEPMVGPEPEASAAVTPPGDAP